MRSRPLTPLLPLLLCVLLPARALAQPPRSAPAAREGAYVPPRGTWERRTPAQEGLDAGKLAEAVAFAQASESKAPRDLEAAHHQSAFGREPFSTPVGPFKTRGPPSGLVLRRGYVVAEWGEPGRVDMVFSVTKSLLSSTVGVAFDQGLIPSLDARVADAVGPVLALPPGGAVTAHGTRMQGTLLEPFATPHNRALTWEHLLRQVSDWEGSLWGKPEWADRPTGEPSTWASRPRVPPGSAYEYNDVRVNALALAATQVWRRPLPQVLHAHVFGPIGASSTWRWDGYDTSWVVLDGQAQQVVSGGGHWGGGAQLDSFDMARFGLLTLRRGRWGERQVLSEAWVKRALTPTPAQPTYGYMNWFLNTDKKMWPSAPASSFAHVGNGTNLIWVDPEHELVVVARWVEGSAVDGLLQRVLASVTR